ncbi:MAG: zinc-binding dehydrogenase [Anaerolineae bacterium]|nr:zinc-binding dehydrogenase [Anaerolineae bacterium]
MTTMRAAILREHGGREQVKLEKIPIPEPQSGEVRIRVHACALNWLDVGVRKGSKFGSIPLPIITGSDIAGVVDKLGDDVSGWQVGDDVTVYPLVTCGVCEFCRQGDVMVCPQHQIIGEHMNGGLAEYVIVPARTLIHKPENLSFAETAALPVVTMTAWHMLIEIGKLRPNETVLIPGAGGGVASIGIQIARHAGARVIATTSTPEKMQKARDFGAHHVFNYRDDDWVQRVLDVTEGRGVDMVQDNVGAATWSYTLETLARNGRLVVCGSHSGTTFELSIPQIYHRQLRILGSNGGTYNGLRVALSLFNQGILRPVVDSILPLDEIHEGHRILEEHDHYGKVVIQMVS